MHQFTALTEGDYPCVAEATGSAGIRPSSTFAHLSRAALPPLHVPPAACAAKPGEARGRPATGGRCAAGCTAPLGLATLSELHATPINTHQPTGRRRRTGPPQRKHRRPLSRPIRPRPRCSIDAVIAYSTRLALTCRSIRRAPWSLSPPGLHPRPAACIDGRPCCMT